jgi:F-type H+-transporting ATPase subunit delta
MAENTTIARPYAQAVFELAQTTGKLAEWADMLALLAMVMEDPAVQDMLKGARLEKHQWIEFVLDVAGNGLTDEGKNLVKVLADNRKLPVIPEIKHQFDALKATHEGYVTVEVISTYAVKPHQQEQLIGALKARLGKEIELKVTINRKLLGGWLIRIGDEVLDLTVRGRLGQLVAGLRH